MKIKEEIKEELREFFKLSREISSFAWSPKIVFIRYFVVLPLLIFIIWLMVR